MATGNTDEVSRGTMVSGWRNPQWLSSLFFARLGLMLSCTHHAPGSFWRTKSSLISECFKHAYPSLSSTHFITKMTRICLSGLCQDPDISHGN
jgi:hypothetical protein